MRFSKKIPLYLQIIIGMCGGIFISIFLISFFPQQASQWNIGYIKPIGTVFVRSLQMLAVPLVLTSLVSGIAGIADLNKLFSIGSRTVVLFFFTALIATSIGVLLAHWTEPGLGLEVMAQEFIQNQKQPLSINTVAQDMTFLQMLAEIFPSNIFEAFASNKQMLQVIVFSILFSIALIRIPADQTDRVRGFMSQLNTVFSEMITLIMLFAPFGVLALICSVSIEFTAGKAEQLMTLFWALLKYSFTVLAGLIIILFGVYALLIVRIGKMNFFYFLKSMKEAFLMAFSSSSSNATLPVTMRCVEDHLKVDKSISGFVLPFGTTINMDGTALYQCVAALFLAQVYGMDLSLYQEIAIVLTAVVAAVGAAGIPGAGMVTLLMVLQSAGIPAEGLVLILIPDRILDMCRTVVNVAGDAMATVVVDAWMKK